MIKGIGVDIVSIPRIEKLVARYGDRFLDKIFTPVEKSYCAAKARPSMHYAARWAAKEAFYKALPDQCQRLSLWKSMEVVSRHTLTRPSVRITDPALTESMKECGISDCHLSLSHDGEFCVAHVVLE